MNSIILKNRILLSANSIGWINGLWAATLPDKWNDEEMFNGFVEEGTRGQC